MGEVAIALVKWTFRTAFIAGVILALLTIFSLIASYLIAGYSSSVLADIFALVQIWLPFNINIILLWISVSATAYFSYRIAIMSYTLLNTFVGKN